MEKKINNLPDFLIIGAGKSGTTSLDNYLKQHPQIFISERKEPNFFGYELNQLSDFSVKSEIDHYKGSVTNLEEYLKLFSSSQPGQLKGETSNTYMYHTTAAERIYHYNPNIKLIAILRQPAERLYSRFLHLARENELPSENFSDCFDKSSIWWWRNDLVKEGMYAQYLTKYYKLFDQNQIKIFLFEDLKSHPEKLFKDIFEFLNVDSSFEPNLSVEYNQSGFIKNKKIDAIFGAKGIINRGVKLLLPRKTLTALKNNHKLQKKIQTLRNRNLHKPKFDNNLKNKITNEIYLEDIKQLEKLIKRDLSHWYL
ncbi:sulfotransferase [Marivirga lumbricoides]|uniref:Sulfotransferase n=1 Tax=Marivirga lumbricoides TaxID=1046115 RepID=A0ABQ1MLF7_9BACT|nr:sulfotransferase [Marivirga lumbricoides]